MFRFRKRKLLLEVIGHMLYCFLFSAKLTQKRQIIALTLFKFSLATLFSAFKAITMGHKKQKESVSK